MPRPLAKVLHDNFRIVNGFMSTIPSYTNDRQHSRPATRRFAEGARGCVKHHSVEHGAAKSDRRSLADLKGKLNGGAYRIPTPEGVPRLGITPRWEKDATVESINAAFKKAAGDPTKRRAGV